MKKTIILLMCLAGLMISVQAQVTEELVSKKGVPILPEEGDIALAVNAIPVFQFVGNMFNGTVNNTLGWNFMTDLVSSNSIYLQYYLEDKTSVRVGFRFGNNQVINQEFVVQDQLPAPDPNVLVTDKMVANNTNLHLGGNYLMHRGIGRLQGYYGGGVTLLYRTNSQKYTYGNPFTSTFTSPASRNFGSNITSTGRLTDVNNVVTIGAGVQALVGVEYYFAPKISIGGEFGYGVMFMKTNGGSSTEERWNGLEVETEETKVACDGAINLDNTNFSGAIYLKFLF